MHRESQFSEKAAISFDIVQEHFDASGQVSTEMLEEFLKTEHLSDPRNFDW